MALVSYILPTQPAGSDGGITAYKNGNQLALRSRARPINPRPGGSQSQKQAIAILSARWELLTNAQRIAWGSYAYNSPLTDAYAMPRYVRGYAHYMRSNRARQILSLPIIDDAPTTPGFPAYTTPTISGVDDFGGFTLSWPLTDEWPNEDGAYLILWVSRPRSAGRRYPPETYTWWDWIAGSSTSPRDSAAESLIIPNTQLSQSWIRTAVTRADGRYTSQ